MIHNVMYVNGLGLGTISVFIFISSTTNNTTRKLFHSRGITPRLPESCFTAVESLLGHAHLILQLLCLGFDLQQFLFHSRQFSVHELTR